MTDLLALTRCSKLGRDLVDFELWRRLVQLIFPFLNRSHTLLSLFFYLLEVTGLAILGDVALDLLLFGDATIPGPTDKAKTLELAVNIAYFSSTVEFFQKAGYDITTTWRDDLKEPEPENVLGKAEGALRSDQVNYTYKVSIIATLGIPLEYIVNLSSTHLMNAVTRAGIDCLYPGLTLDRRGIAMGDLTSTHGIQLESTNRNWTRGKCKSYCPRKRRNANDDPGILAYRWIGSLDRSGAYTASEFNPHYSLSEVGKLVWVWDMDCWNMACKRGPKRKRVWCSSHGFLDNYACMEGLHEGLETVISRPTASSTATGMVNTFSRLGFPDSWRGIVDPEAEMYVPFPSEMTQLGQQTQADVARMTSYDGPS
ncbi:hypothetical protein BKA70DRAFT_1233624 [Coprinopsis sp. MPI-PUGE-AT-0042]|nr:hypothetical protein BKA70DRAFT_1233624 [Coprinopsis sp. MPI-PUGE-AT-0042]